MAPGSVCVCVGYHNHHSDNEIIMVHVNIQILKINEDSNLKNRLMPDLDMSTPHLHPVQSTLESHIGKFTLF